MAEINATLRPGQADRAPLSNSTGLLHRTGQAGAEAQFIIAAPARGGTVPRSEVRSEPGRVVAFVGSAGSIQALRTVLADLAGRLPLPMIVLVHQSTDRPDDSLVSALGRRGDVGVREAQDGEVLRRGQILVIPSGKHLLVHPDRHIELIPAGAYPPNRPSADLLLTTMATALGPDAVAVVLSGGGIDGATGATAIHTNGGAVIATDQETSRAFSMPKATIDRDGMGPHVPKRTWLTCWSTSSGSGPHRCVERCRTPTAGSAGPGASGVR